MRTRALLLIALGVALAGCHARPPAPRLAPKAPVYDEAFFARKPLAAHTLHVATGKDAPLETIVGKRQTYRIRDGDTLLDVARYNDLGYNEIVEANPGVDPWIPKPGSTVVLPTEWVLPCCTYDGLVMNIPEMRLYYYQRTPGDPSTITLRTYPVGLGREDRHTPRGTFRVRGKTVNPRWNIPESIRAEHIRERGDARSTIAGGDPDNPLGKYRIELSIPRYSIHGTNVPWAVGVAASHGCLRLYPEDIELLFPLVTVGTPVELVYQPVKIGVRGGATFVEAHPDLYGFGPSLTARALAALKRQGAGANVDKKLVEARVRASHGLPVRLDGKPS